MMERMFEKFMGEIERLRNEIKEQRRAWIEEKERKNKGDLEERIKELKLKEEKREKEIRRINIVIKGVEWKEQGTTEKVKRFLNEHLKMETKVVETKRVKKKREKDIMIAKISNWKDKKEIMTRKKN